MTPLVVVGAGGFGREILGVIEEVNGPSTDLRTHDAHAVLGIGSPAFRTRVHSVLAAFGSVMPVQPDATVGMQTTRSIRTVIVPRARPSVAATVARHLHVDQNAAMVLDADVPVGLSVKGVPAW